MLNQSFAEFMVKRSVIVPFKTGVMAYADTAAVFVVHLGCHFTSLMPKYTCFAELSCATQSPAVEILRMCNVVSSLHTVLDFPHGMKSD